MMSSHFPDSLINYSSVHVTTSEPKLCDRIQLDDTKDALYNLACNRDIPRDRVLSKSSTLTASQTSSKRSSEQIEVLNQLLPPRKYYDVEKKVYYVQYVSLKPATRKDLYTLNEKLNFNLRKSSARQVGICSIRRKYFKECFDEIIRQVGLECCERGILLARIREEIDQTIDTYRMLYTSASAFGVRRMLLNEDKSSNLCTEIESYKSEISELSKQLNEMKMLKNQLEKQLKEQEKAFEDAVKEINEKYVSTLNDYKMQIAQFTTKSIQQLKSAAISI